MGRSPVLLLAMLELLFGGTVQRADCTPVVEGTPLEVSKPVGENQEGTPVATGWPREELEAEGHIQGEGTGGTPVVLYILVQ